MATNDIGRVTPIWRGFFSAATTYELNDIVIDTAGSVWWHKSEELTTGVIPEAGEIWDAVIDMSVFSGLIQAAITTAQTALAAAQEAVAEVTADTERAETAARNAETFAQNAAESAASVGAQAQAAERSAEAAAGSATGAAESAQAAAGSKSDAEAYAVGKRGGEDVESADPTYHNNAKYYAEQAESEAEAAAQSAEDAQDVLDSIPEDYSQMSADVSELKTRTDFVGDIVSNGVVWTMGGINASTGADSNTELALTKRFRTDKVPVNPELRIDIDDTVEFKLFAFKSDGTALYMMNANNWFTQSVNVMDVVLASSQPQNVYSVRIMGRRADDEIIEDLANVTSHITVRYANPWEIDNTLSKSDMPADAKAAGDAIALCFQSRSSLEDGTDLNSVLTEGHWFLSGNNTYTNSPLGNGKAGTLEVLKTTTNFTLQRISSYDGLKVWIRTSTGGSFSGRDWIYTGPDTTLTKANEAAEAKKVGDILFGSRGAEIDDSEPLIYYRYASGDTWSDVPLGSFTFNSGATFDTVYSDCPVKAGSASVFVEVYGGRKKTGGGAVVPKRVRIIRAAILSDPIVFLYGYVTEAATSIAWRVLDYARKPSISIAYFGDSITRGVVDNSTTPTTMASIPIPEGVAAELSCRCENFGIGSIGWCNNGGDSANKGIAYEYLKRWVAGDTDWYGTAARQFLGTGSIDDFDTVVLAYGANDNIHYNLGSLDDVSSYDSLTDEQFDPETLTDLTIIVQIYRCVRYLKKEKPTINIILVAPFVAGSFRPTGDYTREYMDHTKNSLIAAYKAFAERYGCGFISTYDAPIDRFNLSGVLNNGGVHPNDATYIALGKYMAGKISAQAM